MNYFYIWIIVNLEKLVDSHTQFREITDTLYFKHMWKKYHTHAETQTLYNHTIKPYSPNDYFVDKEVDKFGKRFGKSITYRADTHQVILDEDYWNDKLDGDYIQYYEDEPIQRQLLKCSQGQRIGVATFWNMDGQIIFVTDGGCDSEGCLDGTQRLYYPDGSICWDDYMNGHIFKLVPLVPEWRSTLDQTLYTRSSHRLPLVSIWQYQKPHDI